MNTKDTARRKRNKDILFPDKTIEDIVIKNKIVRIDILILKLLNFASSINPKSKKNENFCINPPAIASVWKGPVSLCSKGLVRPKKSLP